MHAFIILIKFPLLFFLYSQFPFSKDQVRILLFRECDWRGRRLLFDSSAIEPVTATPIQSQQQQQQHTVMNTSATQTKPLPLKLDKNNIEYYEGKPYKVCVLNAKKIYNFKNFL